VCVCVCVCVCVLTRVAQIITATPRDVQSCMVIRTFLYPRTFLLDIPRTNFPQKIPPTEQPPTGNFPQMPAEHHSQWATVICLTRDL